MTNENFNEGLKSGAVGCALPFAAVAAILGMVAVAYSAVENQIEEAAANHAASVEAAGRAAIDYATARQIDAVTQIAVESARAMQTRATIMEVGYTLLLMIFAGVVLLLLTGGVFYVVRECIPPIAHDCLDAF